MKPPPKRQAEQRARGLCPEMHKKFIARGNLQILVNQRDVLRRRGYNREKKKTREVGYPIL